MSFCATAIVAAMNAVASPTMAMTVDVSVAAESTGLMRTAHTRQR